MAIAPWCGLRFEAAQRSLAAIALEYRVHAQTKWRDTSTASNADGPMAHGARRTITLQPRVTMLAHLSALYVDQEFPLASEAARRRAAGLRQRLWCVAAERRLGRGKEPPGTGSFHGVRGQIPQAALLTGYHESEDLEARCIESIGRSYKLPDEWQERRIYGRSSRVRAHTSRLPRQCGGYNAAQVAPSECALAATRLPRRRSCRFGSNL